MTAESAERAATGWREPQVTFSQQRNLYRYWTRFKRNRAAVLSACVLGMLMVLALLAPTINAELLKIDPNAIDLVNVRAVPSRAHLLGTDELGREVLARLLVGGRISLAVGLSVVAISAAIGLLVGLSAAYLGGLVENSLMRFVDTMLAIPSFYLALAVASMTRPSVLNVILIIALTSWMGSARLVRSEGLSLREREYVTAARCFGATDLYVILHHILPGVVPTLTVASTLGVAGAILTESGLSFLGVGVRPPMASWGSLLTNAQIYLWTTPLLAVYPGLLIMITVLALNFVGDGLRESLDPRLQ